MTTFDVRASGGIVIAADDWNGVHYLRVVLREGEIARIVAALSQGDPPAADDITYSVDETGVCIATAKDGDYWLRHYVVVLSDHERERIVSDVRKKLKGEE